ncbi:MAG: cyclin-dependent kinase inhibitor 3 family protein [Novosphingobium sp.]|nr:cyclin-dependent kinase inhibitor 3 family protein [Novosphingobium sp.]
MPEHPESRNGRSPRVRTSVSHPLRIDAVVAGSSCGLIGITFCPGKQGASESGYVWNRDLEQDLDTIATWKPAAMVTLIEAFEFAMLGVPDLGSRVQARGIEWHHLPIVDVQPPDARFEAQWSASGPRLLQLLRSGQRLVVHCRGGLGRAGTVSARLLVELGVEPAEAMRRVRQVRPGAIETLAQERYVLALTGRAMPGPGDL